jgi:hypothetical protein
MAARKRREKGGDPLKSYTLVMALLVVVMGVLYFVIDGTRKDYEQANQQLRGWLRSVEGSSTPSTIPELAYAVEKYAKTFEDAAGGTGLLRGIPLDMMKQEATRAGLKQVYAGREVQDRSGNYETITLKLEYEAPAGGPTRIWRLLALLYNIEARGRYRVSEVTWEVADPTDVTPGGPLDQIKKPRITVALRLPVLE